MYPPKPVSPYHHPGDAVHRPGVPESLLWDTGSARVSTQVLATTLRTPQSHCTADGRSTASGSILMFTAAAHRLATDDELILARLACTLPDFGRYEKLLVPHSCNNHPQSTRASQPPNSAPVKFLFLVFTLIPSRYRTEAFPPSCLRVQVLQLAFTVFSQTRPSFVAPRRATRRQRRRYPWYRRHRAHRTKPNLSLPTSTPSPWLNNSTWVV